MTHDVKGLFACLRAFKEYDNECLYLFTMMYNKTSSNWHRRALMNIVFPRLGNIALGCCWPWVIFPDFGKTIFTEDFSTSHYLYNMTTTETTDQCSDWAVVISCDRRLIILIGIVQQICAAWQLVQQLRSCKSLGLLLCPSTCLTIQPHKRIHSSFSVTCNVT